MWWKGKRGKSEEGRRTKKERWKKVAGFGREGGWILEEEEEKRRRGREERKMRKKRKTGMSFQNGGCSSPFAAARLNIFLQSSLRKVKNTLIQSVKVSHN